MNNTEMSNLEEQSLISEIILPDSNNSLHTEAIRPESEENLIGDRVERWYTKAKSSMSGFQ